MEVFYFDEYPPMAFKCPTHRISMKKAIDFDRFDIVHSHCLRPDIYLSKWKKKIHKAKIITTLHQDTYQTFRYQYNSLLTWLFTKYWCRVQSKFDGVVAISKQLEDAYKTRIKASFTTIYNGCVINDEELVNADVGKAIQRLKSKYALLGTYAFITRRKGVGQVLRVLPQLKEFAFVIIGEGPDVENLKKLTYELNITERVLFLPYQSNPHQFLRYFDIYIMSSYSEGFGLAMVEAALCERSIVCSNIHSFHELFDESQASFFNLDNAQSLQNAIVRAFEGRHIYGRLAKERATERFTVPKMAENYLNYYQAISK